MQVTILGLGLIGGSIARALHETGDWRVTGWSPSPETRRAALDAGAIERAVEPARALPDTELLVLAAPPLVCLELIDELAGPLGRQLDPATSITDVASTKAQIVARAEDGHLPFVGGHPMAGRETSGFRSSTADLFVDRPWVIVRSRSSRQGDVDRVDALARACRARPMAMDAEAHDEAAAAISHLPLVVAAALVESVCGRPGEPVPEGWAAASRLAASGWRDMTRLARGDASMGAGILATNAGPVASRLVELRAVLDEWIRNLTAGGVDAAAVETRLRADAARAGATGAAAGGSQPAGLRQAIDPPAQTVPQAATTAAEPS